MNINDSFTAMHEKLRALRSDYNTPKQRKVLIHDLHGLVHMVKAQHHEIID